MGQRARRRDRGPSGPDRTAARYERGRQRDAEARAQLVPLAPGERPRPVTVAVVVAVLLAVANTVLAFAARGAVEGGLVPQLVFTAVILVAAAGMWAVKYWAVLGFQALLVVQILAMSLALLRVEKWWVALLLVAFISLFGWLFFKLIRAMARIQMPAR